MKQRNPRFGCLRIAQQINLAFGLDLDKDTVRRVLAVHYKPDPDNRGPSWLTTPGHAKDSLWSRDAGPFDLFRAESITLKTHWIMVVMDQYTRRVFGFAVHAGNVHGHAVCRMFNDATSGQGLPERLSTVNDPLFQYHRWKANLRVLDSEEIKSLPHIPMSHPFVERLIGSVRRGLLDQTLFWTVTDLENKLLDYQSYYNESRCHSSRIGQPPIKSGGDNVIDIRSYQWEKHCRGLFQLPAAA
jgi:transposase InsO family protein